MIKRIINYFKKRYEDYKLDKLYKKKIKELKSVEMEISKRLTITIKK